MFKLIPCKEAYNIGLGITMFSLMVLKRLSFHEYVLSLSIRVHKPKKIQEVSTSALQMICPPPVSLPPAECCPSTLDASIQESKNYAKTSRKNMQRPPKLCNQVEYGRVRSMFSSMVFVRSSSTITYKVIPCHTIALYDQ